jgi:transposase-like protein
MRKEQNIEGRACPKCGQTHHQINSGYTRAGTQRCLCKSCNYKYSPHPKKHAYSEEERATALKLLYSGMSGCGVGRVMHMSKCNAYAWVKKSGAGVDKSID